MNLDSVGDVVTSIESLVSERPGRTVWVGIDGFGGSGKTTLARWLSEELAGAQLISVDDFAEPGVPTWDFERFAAQVVQPLDRGESARYEKRGWNVSSTSWVTVPSGLPVLVEGVSVTDSSAGLDWDLTVWVHTEPAERRRRIRLRDDADTLAIWESDWWPSERAYAAEQNPAARADHVVSGERLPPR